MRQIAARDARVLWHPYHQHGGGGDLLPIRSAQGAWLELEDGRRVLDGIASWWACLHGHATWQIVEAIARQAERLDHVQFGSATHEPAVQLAEALLARAPAGLSRVFFSDDGSTAVETALKMALGYFRRRGEKRQLLLAFESAYHGDTSGAMSVSARSVFTSDFDPLLVKVLRVAAPVGEVSLEQAIAALDAALERHGHEIAAAIVEPRLLGAAGMRVTPVEHLLHLRAATRQHGILLLADEVLTGFGRTGPLFACQTAGITPDLLCLSKALTGGILPLAATLASEEIFESFRGTDLSRAFLHGHTFTAHPIGCAAALASLDLLDEAALARASDIGTRLEEGLAPLRSHPNVKELRGIGLIRAVELKTPSAGYFSRAGSRLSATALAEGVFLRPLGNVLYALLPLCVTNEEIDLVVHALHRCVQSAQPGAT